MKSERGFTLIEMIVTLAISGIIVVGLTQAVMVSLRTLQKTNDRLSGSNDTQLVASWFTSDVASAESVSTSGTTSHVAPSLSVPNNTELITFYTLQRATTITAPDGMAGGWGTSSTGTGAGSRFTIGMADDGGLSGNTRIRVADSADPTSSIGHSVALTPAALQTVTRRSVLTAANGNATTLMISRPYGVANNDQLLAQIAVAGGTDRTITAPAGWTLVDTRSSGTAVKSAIFKKTAGNSEPSVYTWTFNGAAEAVGGVAAYSGSNGVSAQKNDVSPCGGGTPALLLRWTDRGTSVAHSITYNLASGDAQNQLVRRHCTGDVGVPVDTQTLANFLAPNGVVATCSKAFACGPLPVTVTLSVSEPPLAHETTGRTYQLRAGTRTNS